MNNNYSRLRHIMCFLIVILSSKYLLGQTENFERFHLVADAQVLNNPSFGIGIGIMPNNDNKFKSCGGFLLTEWIPSNKELQNHTFGIRGLAVIRHKFINFGYSFSLFTNFNKGFGLFTPELGFGFKYGFLVYRINLSIFNKEENVLGRHNLSLRFYLPIK
jgi:hypothetical protein